jgi:hypothetical protein
MKNHLIAAFLCIAIFGGMLLAVGCQPPGVTQGTIEVDYVNSNGCSVVANLDGSQTTTFTSPLFYTFPNTVTPGNHTLNFSTGGSCVANSCVFPNSSTHDSVTFSVGGGDVYEETVSEGTPNCNNILLSGS